jgi:hypothetical protein
VNIVLKNNYQRAGISEIVHIYSNMETKAEYAYTEADFVDVITLSGTITTAVNGVAPSGVYISARTENGNEIGYTNIPYSAGSAGSAGTPWSINIPVFSEETPITFGVSLYDSSNNIGSVSNLSPTLVHNSAVSDISLNVDYSFVTLSGTIGAVTVNGAPPEEFAIEAYNQNGDYLGNAWQIDSSGAWAINIPTINTNLASTDSISFQLNLYKDGSYMTQDIPDVTRTYSGQSISNIALGDVSSTFITLSGTITATVNGVAPSGVYISARTENGNEIGYTNIPYSAGTPWSINIPVFSVETPITFRVSLYDSSNNNIGSVSNLSPTSVHNSAVPAISLNVDYSFVTLSGTIGAVTVNGAPSDEFAIEAYNQNGDYLGNALQIDSSGAWTINIPPTNTALASTNSISFQLYLYKDGSYMTQDIPDVTQTYSGQSISNIALGDVSAEVLPGIAGMLITDMDLTDYIPAPVEGRTPAAAFVGGVNAAQYTVGTVTWNPGHIRFHDGTEYNATVTLTAAAGYTFTGMKSRFFHAEGDISVLSISSGTIVLDIAFRRLSPVPVIGATWYVDETGDDDDSGTSAIQPLKTIQKALEKAAAASLNDGETAEIVLLSDLTPTDAMETENDYKYLIVIDENHPPILLRSQSSQSPRTVWLEEGDYKTLITVTAGATLTLKHITIQGQGIYNITLIGTAGDLVLESGASVKDGKKKDGGTGYNGGVSVRSGGTFTMNKGTISGNHSADFGGGVWVMGGTFTMNGGVISGNTADYYAGGGIYVSSSSQFTMNGGVISGNTAGYGYGYIYGSGGGGVRVSSSTFTMEGGSIRGNSAISGGEYGGGGVAVSGTTSQFTKTGGVIYGSDAYKDALKNTTTNGNGHAVYVYVSGSPAKIRDSTADEVVTMDSGSSDGWE